MMLLAIEAVQEEKGRGRLQGRKKREQSRCQRVWKELARFEEICMYQYCMSAVRVLNHIEGINCTKLLCQMSTVTFIPWNHADRSKLH